MTRSDTHLRLGADLLRGHRTALAVIAVLALASTGASVAVPWLVKDMISNFARGTSVTGPIILTVTAAIGGATAMAIAGYLLGRSGEQMILSLRQKAMSHILHLPMATVRSQGAGNLTARITADAYLLRSVIDVGLVQFPLSALTVAFTLAVMAYLDWQLTLLTIASFAVASVLVGFVLKKVKKNVIDQQNALGDLAQRFTSYLGALTTIKATRHEAQAAEKLGHHASELTDVSLVGARLQAFITPAMGLGQQIALVVVVIAGGARIVHGHLTTAAFSAFILYLLQLVTPVTVAATGIGRFQAGMAARTRFDELFALEIEADAPHARTPAKEHDAPAVEFRSVHYAYPGSPDVLKQLTFSAPAAGLTAIVGPSGIGKSTTLSLIERFIAPDRGTISVLGTDISTWPLSELRNRISYVDQQFTLVEGSIRENLQLGRTHSATDEELHTALRAVDMFDAIEALPHRMDTVLGREMDLSGGQRQRLALARALLTQADIVLLDEPTSQMDGINEKRFRDVVDELARSRAVIVVAHRLTTIQHADHVVMFSTGSQTTAGTHDHLMENSTGYRELVTSQAGH